MDVFFRGYGVWVEEHKGSSYTSEPYLASGIFKLSDKDEIAYKHTKSLKHTKTLLPSTHPDSETLRIGKSEGPWDAGNDFWLCVFNEKNCYFVIHQTQTYELSIAEPSTDPNIAVVDSTKRPQHLSNDLAILNKAAFEFWSTADPDDKNTHPTNEDVFNWLKKQGFSDDPHHQKWTIQEASD